METDILVCVFTCFFSAYGGLQGLINSSIWMEEYPCCSEELQIGDQFQQLIPLTENTFYLFLFMRNHVYIGLYSCYYYHYLI